MIHTTASKRTRRQRCPRWTPITPRSYRRNRSISNSCLPHREQEQEIATMFDELDRLAEIRPLYDLLVHYGNLGHNNREAWQDRLQQLHDLEPRQMSKLHGELLAYGWLEQNTGLTPVLKVGVASACYRITAAGVKVLKQARSEQMHAA